MKLAIVSPSKNAYSESFIQAHKEYIRAEKFYYYGGYVPTHLKGKGPLSGKSFLENLKMKVKSRLPFYNGLREREIAFLDSLKNNGIQVVLAEYGPTGAEVVTICKKLKLPLIVHFHGYDASVVSILEQKKQSYKMLFEYAEAVVVVSRLMEQRLLEMGCPAQKLVYNVYGPSVEFEKIKPEYSENLLIAVGRFVDKKAPYYTILAFNIALKKFPDAKLVMGGDGELRSTCQNLVKYFGIEKNVILPGVINQSEFISYLKVGKAFVQHSITAANGDMEGTPVAIIEASAAGLPIISTVHAGIPDVVLEGVTGLLVQEHDVKGMANNMMKVLGDLDYTKELGQAGKKRIKGNFTLEKHVNALSDLINAAHKKK